ncbi:hypothetical protein [Xanthomonas sp. NCPPB 1128]|uniref:hypothetical protein n=1 Tax=Xanthomonas sp. NCPPB 1128 TaxID=1775876 RepID=UPI0010387417|nr:hypothetical protein [Xanthomonas sp. NCPPB 1128]
MEIDGKINLSPADFDFCPAWRYDEDSDLFFPVRCEQELPELARDLSIRAQFIGPTGEQFEGYIVGVDRVFSIGLFCDGCVFYVNKNMPGASKEQIDNFLLMMGRSLDFYSMFPLSFETRWGNEIFSNFSGIFSMQ